MWSLRGTETCQGKYWQALVSVYCMTLALIAQFRYNKIQPKTIDLNTRLRGIDYRVCGVYSLEPCAEV